jgi:hypothetical protein
MCGATTEQVAGCSVWMFNLYFLQSDVKIKQVAGCFV